MVGEEKTEESAKVVVKVSPYLRYEKFELPKEVSGSSFDDIFN